MTCRHGKFDPACSSYDANIRALKQDYEKQILGQTTPDSKNFTIEDIEEVDGFLVVKALYPNCVKCSYEGVKVMVFEGVTIKDAIKWKTLDPHFRDKQPQGKTEAPGPVARFPASEQGWQNALVYAKSMSKK